MVLSNRSTELQTGLLIHQNKHTKQRELLNEIVVMLLKGYQVLCQLLITVLDIKFYFHPAFFRKGTQNKHTVKEFKHYRQITKSRNYLIWCY